MFERLTCQVSAHVEVLEGTVTTNHPPLFSTPPPPFSSLHTKEIMSSHLMSALIGMISVILALKYTPMSAYLGERESVVVEGSGRLLCVGPDDAKANPSSLPTLLYFSARGRAEKIQLLLELGGCSYHRVFVEDWPALKAEAVAAGFSFTQLPALLLPPSSLSHPLTDRPLLTPPPVLASLLPSLSPQYYALTQTSAILFSIAHTHNLPLPPPPPHPLSPSLKPLSYFFLVGNRVRVPGYHQKVSKGRLWVRNRYKKYDSPLIRRMRAVVRFL
jgi:hypothetical protein